MLGTVQFFTPTLKELKAVNSRRKIFTLKLKKGAHQSRTEHGKGGLLYIFSFSKPRNLTPADIYSVLNRVEFRMRFFIGQNYVGGKEKFYVFTRIFQLFYT